ncbi:MAG: rod shape-determining protein MreC [Saprospiraceae bacterium]|nr:rod shape-determining protein MreC [Saprospiraceae bacterium]
MINLLYFLSRYGGVLAFVILELLSVYLVVRYNQTQREIYLNSSRFYSGVLLEKTAKIRHYASMAEIADSLAEENALLYNRLYSQLAITPRENEVDSLFSPFEFIPARVIKNSINQPNNNLTLNKGELDGVKQGMGVVLPRGVLGIVRNTSPHFCRVLSLLNSQTYVGAAIRRNGAFGVVHWDGVSPAKVILEEIPKHLDILIGDTVVTSGHSSVFPPNLEIGKVISYYVPSGSNSYRIEVNLFVDLSRINRAYIVRNRYWDELQSLETTESQ